MPTEIEEKNTRENSQEGRTDKKATVADERLGSQV
jgi:hypothetical protein